MWFWTYCLPYWFEGITFADITLAPGGQIWQTSVVPGEGYRLNDTGKIVYRRLKIRGFIVFCDDIGFCVCREAEA